MNRFQHKVALVTGGGSGIGLAITERLSEEGARVFTAQRSRIDTPDSIEVDLADASSVSDVIDSVIKQAGQIDVLVNNAGVMMEADVTACSLDDWNNTLAVNLTAPFLLMQAAVPHMQEGSAIVNVGSIEGLGSNPQHPAYCASKAGLHGLTRAVAVDHGKAGIRCNAVAPGWINTDLNNAFIESMPDSQHFRESIAGIHPVNRTGDVKDVAALVAFLASSDAAFITGQVYTIDGGRMAKLSLP